MSDWRFRSTWALAIGLALAACSAPTAYSNQIIADDGGGDDSVQSADPESLPKHNGRPRHDAGTQGNDARPADARPGDASPADARPDDAGPPDASSTDAGPADGSGGGSGSGSLPGGTVSCYSDGFPSTTCRLPTHCCFSNYSAQHNGECTTSSCTWGTLECDGPEDCSGGQHCCAHVLWDPDEGMLGYRVACQASACGASPANEELCHPGATQAGTCSTGRRCVSAAGNDSDLPITLRICR